MRQERDSTGDFGGSRRQPPVNAGCFWGRGLRIYAYPVSCQKTWDWKRESCFSVIGTILDGQVSTIGNQPDRHIRICKNLRKLRGGFWTTPVNQASGNGSGGVSGTSARTRSQTPDSMAHGLVSRSWPAQEIGLLYVHVLLAGQWTSVKIPTA